MKTIKPQKLGLLTRVFENEQQAYLVVSLIGFFPFEAPGKLLPEVSLWKLLASQLGPEAVLDVGMSKIRGEVLVTGRAYPRGGARPACSVRVRVGEAIDKELYVVGDRRWELDGPSEPQPFAEMPIDWAHAFGGEGYAQNPLGKGYAPIRGEAGEVHPLPNIEIPGALLRSPGDRPPPAGLGPYDVTWPQRAQKAGTYDAAWLEERFPGFARDMDWGYFNAAPEDQQIEGYFAGDERFSIQHMHPTRPLLESRLPGVRARCFITRKTEQGESFVDIPTRLDTVWLFPGDERGVVIFRGVAKVQEDDAADVLHLVAGFEAMGAPKPVEHYRTVLAQRLDKAKGILYSLRDRDLLPPPGPDDAPVPEDTWNDTADLIATADLVRKNMRRRGERILEEIRQQCVAMGLDPDKHLPAALPAEEQVPALDELPEYIEEVTRRVEAEQEKAKAARAKAEDATRKALADHGIDYDKVLAEAKERGGGGPPGFSADRELERLRMFAELSRNTGVPIGNVEEQLADPQIEQKLRRMEETMLRSYRQLTHHFPAARPIAAEASALVREEVKRAREAGESLARTDLTGADLSHLDLSGLVFTESLLERVDLTGADLTGADLRDATLARARLDGANFGRAGLAGANLALARARGASFAGADLTGAVLHQADLEGANLRGARLARVDLSEASLKDADLGEISAPETNFMNNDFSGVKLDGADLSKCTLLHVNVQGADLSRAKLEAATFLGAHGDRAVLRGADLRNLRAVMECSFDGADMSDARLAGANLRGSRLRGADLSRADLAGADLSECDLSGAKLQRAQAPSSMFAKAKLTGAEMTAMNLMESVLQKAHLTGADLRGANLFRADLARVRADRTTDFTGAHMKRVRFVAARPNAKR
ncbi:DUF2169 domain-containing protein [Sorangium sp. So ce861]|uniref:DUF2169 family type VI secretion system accessory protein n=1 Tax=Sorangium sp. So ce861 TaxID=3133323 RepID=UPI003F5ED79E